MVCVVTMIFFMINNSEDAALTMWSVYIMFLLYTIILDSKIHAAIFTVLSVITQIVFWILIPKIQVTIDGNEYLLRIFIIILSYYGVRYLRSEYALKEIEYRRFAKEQAVLEKISTNFISLKSENVKVKVDEMFVMSLEILEYNHAYLLEVDDNYKEVIVISSHTHNTVKDFIPFASGIKMNIEDIPIVRHFFNERKPVICEDIENSKYKIGDDEKSYFLAREINSFSALPITIDDTLIAVLVFEYHEISDKKSKESRLYFLKMIANILLDTKKKILYEERLYNFAFFDETTRIANRNMLKSSLEQIVRNKEQQNDNEIFALLNVELDNLRTINDTFGHDIGEQVVIKSADILKSLMQDDCIISRISDEKFILVMDSSSDRKQLEDYAKRIIASFAHPILMPELDIEALFVTVRIGISIFPYDGRDVRTLLKNADLAGHEATFSDNRIVFCSDFLKNRVEENTLITHKLFRALENKEFSLEFQPQICCISKKTAGIEALLRWTTSDNKKIPPDRFIPILEKTGLIHDVGLWVLDQTLQEHNRLLERGFKPLRVSVNLSIMQFYREDFVENISKIIEKHKVKPEYIEVEITESMLAKNLTETVDKLLMIKKLGIKIAVDDFGKGYSSLNRLFLVPLDRIKIDKSIIDNILTEKKNSLIANLVISLAKDLQLEITAEGVETKEQADYISSVGCDEIQGFFYSKPLSTDALEKFLINEKSV